MKTNLLQQSILFFKDPKFWIPLLILVLFEIILSLGAWKPFLKKNSYAANVNRILNHAIDQNSEKEPNILILGTSIAFEGLSVRVLNQELEPLGYTVQTIAIPGSELIVQELALEKVLHQFPKTKLILHIMEPGMPWVAKTDIALPTLAMLSELDRFRAIQLLYENGYDVHIDDLFYLSFKSIAYRRDFAEFFSSPEERIKFISRNIKSPNTEYWDYDNPHTESIAGYKFKTIEECLVSTNPNNKEPIPSDSSPEHKIMVYNTCALAKITPNTDEPTKLTELYFKRLNKMYDIPFQKGIQIWNVFAPYSEVISVYSQKQRMKVWYDGLQALFQEKNKPLKIIDLQTILNGDDNSKYCFDLIHLNRFGMIAFSEALAKQLKSELHRGTE